MVSLVRREPISEIAEGILLAQHRSRQRQAALNVLPAILTEVLQPLLRLHEEALNSGISTDYLRR
ncbi:hypothetical protein [Bosea vaviloviae]|uniref:hypothetical protein n=1 Tax=Bosea vaviloviae TaxID=1526658 RepID=UPI0006BAAC55|nr:hypothetical protein [Bosea vaviloviae]